MGDLHVIQRRYEKTEHLDFPEMKSLINQLIENPDAEITISDEFLEKRYDKRGILLGVVAKIKITLEYLWQKLKVLFSTSYRARFDKAVSKIIDSFNKKIFTMYYKAIDIINVHDKFKVLLQEIEVLEKGLEQSKLRFEVVKKAVSYLDISEGGFFARLMHSTEINSLKDEILKLDPNFSLQSLSKDQLIIEQQNLLKECDEKTKIRAQLVKERDECKTKSDAAIKDLESLTNNIDQLFPTLDAMSAIFSSSESVDGIVSPENNRSPHYLKMLEDIQKHTDCRELKILWNSLLCNFTDLDDRIESWECSEEGDFTLKLHRPLKIWMNVTEPKGGCVFLLGDNEDRKIQGKLNNNEMSFDKESKGFTSKSLYGFLGVVTPTMGGLFFKESSSITASPKIIIPGTYLGQTEKAETPYSELKKVWQNKTHLVLEDDFEEYKNFLKSKT